ncbi:nitrobindin family protein [Parenemella sanctibonifatiensis]|uniref:Ferric nitrobindin-like protein n=1 Tax=Parenemella sanctibonifatiensis TaxID=2016505 RepID=A0A255ELY9_9ACTN|nr:FABP family protein [Parenemella sanctibonifatiensis]OYN92526.1 FABP family protein [Parenemella sanctibonifatiensis]
MAPDNLHESLLGLSWLIGRWEGSGKGTWPGEGEFEYGQQVDVAHNGGPYLHYMSQMFAVDEAGKATKPLAMESGFWRPAGGNQVELLLSNAEGRIEMWYGDVTGKKIELKTDAVIRSTSSEVTFTAGHRLYGHVEGDLLWTLDRATEEHEMQTYLWARLARAEG